jgi:hypothetical protein
MHDSEADDLMAMGIDLIERHEPCWQPAVRLKADMHIARAAISGVVEPTGLGDNMVAFDPDWMSWIDVEMDWRGILSNDQLADPQ